jgi:hypothetical protein
VADTVLIPLQDVLGLVRFPSAPEPAGYLRNELALALSGGDADFRDCRPPARAYALV